MSDKLTAESTAVKLYAAATMVPPESIIAMLEMQNHPTVQMAKLMMANISREHERLCLARLATAEREAQVRALRGAMELCDGLVERSDEKLNQDKEDKFSLGQWGAADHLSEKIQDLITAAEQPQENANG